MATVVLTVGEYWLTLFSVLFLFVCFVYRSTGLGRGRQGGHPAGTPSGGAEDLCKEEEATQTAHVPQDADEDH